MMSLRILRVMKKSWIDVGWISAVDGSAWTLYRYCRRVVFGTLELSAEKLSVSIESHISEEKNTGHDEQTSITYM